MSVTEPIFSDGESDFELEDIIPSLTEVFASIPDHEYMLFE